MNCILMYFNKLINTKETKKQASPTQPNVKYLGGPNVKIKESTIEIYHL